VRLSSIAPIPLVCAIAASSCTPVQPQPARAQNTLPSIDQIRTSNKSFSVDCVPTSITVTAHITDTVRLQQVTLFYRVGSDQPYAQVPMNSSGTEYTATVKATDMPIGSHGTWEFYVTARDAKGNQGKSALNDTVELLPCVSS
jgi:hypothetical protein